jgi:hypothetical protein
MRDSALSGLSPKLALEALLVSRPHRLCFNPGTKASKRIVFGPDGIIADRPRFPLRCAADHLAPIRPGPLPSVIEA